MSCRQHGYPWPSLATFPYRSSPPAGLLGYTLCPHIAAVTQKSWYPLKLMMQSTKQSINKYPTRINSFSVSEWKKDWKKERERAKTGGFKRNSERVKSSCAVIPVITLSLYLVYIVCYIHLFLLYSIVSLKERIVVFSSVAFLFYFSFQEIIFKVFNII